MATLHEISGAKERPSGCRILITQWEDGAIEIAIPPRGAPLMVIIPSALLLIFLLLTIYTGIMLFFAHRSVLGMSQISPGDLPVPMRRYEIWFGFGWVFMESLGFFTLATLARPMFLHESLLLDRQSLHYEARLFRPIRRYTESRANLRGFHLVRDPQGLIPSVLTVESRGTAWPIAEYVSEADREWLESVGNALLRNY